jgi:hypothetical protein
MNKQSSKKTLYMVAVLMVPLSMLFHTKAIAASGNAQKEKCSISLETKANERYVESRAIEECRKGKRLIERKIKCIRCEAPRYKKLKAMTLEECIKIGGKVSEEDLVEEREIEVER